MTNSLRDRDRLRDYFLIAVSAQRDLVQALWQTMDFCDEEMDIGSLAEIIQATAAEHSGHDCNAAADFVDSQFTTEETER